jgi:opacity protein-like surface antigen
MNTKKSIVTIVLAAAFLVSMAGMASADGPDVPLGTTTWDLDNETTTAGYEMEKSGTGQTQTGNVPIAANSGEIWISDQPAQCDVGFGGDRWDLTLYRLNTASAHNFTAYLGVWNETLTSFRVIATSNPGNFEAGKNYTDVDIHAPGFTVLNGEYLALRVNDTDGSPLTVLTGGASYSASHITYASESNFPVPELSTIVLMSVGLLALVGYVGLRRRKN